MVGPGDVRIADQLLADPVDIGLQRRIGIDGADFPLDLARQLGTPASYRRRGRTVWGLLAARRPRPDEQRESGQKTAKNHWPSLAPRPTLDARPRRRQSPRGWNNGRRYGSDADGNSHAAFRNPSSLRPVSRRSRPTPAACWPSTGGTRSIGSRAAIPRRARAVPAWRARRRLGAGSSPLLRSAILSHRGVRPARLRPLDAARRTARQHHGPSRRGHGTAEQHLGIDQWLLFGGSWGSTLHWPTA